MTDSEDAEDRTEAATPRRLQQAREEGRLAVSHELPMFGGLAAGVLALHWFGRDIFTKLLWFLGSILSYSGGASVGDMRHLYESVALALLKSIAPFVFAAWLGAAVMVLGQTGFLLRPQALVPDFSRINPVSGARRLFSMEPAVESIKSIVKIFAATFAIILAVHGDIGQLRSAMTATPTEFLGLLLIPASHVAVAAILVQAVIAGMDLLWVKIRHARSLRMSRQEIRDEFREAEGDPKIKARIRQIRVQRSRRRMLAGVAKATVVVTNPTHYAVALLYTRGGTAAPKVVAKGVDSMAARIREAATAHNVPLVANPPLARALYTVELDHDIPAEHYKAVAEIIAYVWQIGRRAAAYG